MAWMTDVPVEVVLHGEHEWQQKVVLADKAGHQKTSQPITFSANQSSQGPLLSLTAL